MNELQKKFVHGGNVYAEKPKSGEWLDFSANINPLGLPSKVLEAVRQNIPQIIHYPDPAGRELKEALADFYLVPQNEIVLGNGAAELLYVYFHMFRPRRVLLPMPSFSEYERAALSAGAEVCCHELFAAQGFTIGLDTLLPKLSEVDCLVIGNPNNPTGSLLTAAELERCVQAAAAVGTAVIVDESFIEFLPEEKDYTVRQLVARYPNLGVLQSLTKFYAIPGIRLGFGLFSPEASARMEQGKDPWNVNLLAQKAGVAALHDRDYQQQARRYVQNEKDYLANALQKLDGIKVYPPTVNFIFLDLKAGGWNSAAFAQQMRRRGILIRDCANYSGLGDTFIRVAVKSHNENQQLLDAFRDILAGGAQ